VLALIEESGQVGATSLPAGLDELDRESIRTLEHEGPAFIDIVDVLQNRHALRNEPGVPSTYITHHESDVIEYLAPRRDEWLRGSASV